MIIYFTCFLLPGISINSFETAAVVIITLTLINTLIRPTGNVITSPARALSFGLFTFVLNALMLILEAHMIDEFVITNFGWAILASLIISTFHELMEW